ncbi:natural killer cells antigen CD94 [Pipistrellus kuhlii]|uniref:natural killer cells antigen CD94 n=1 Tax=Pipistrellus kuhlii TaxID=59472 RepID=UPI001E270A5D|nr:natural killer cells antigen CD94 [Pipistrellus kuhlii]
MLNQLTALFLLGYSASQTSWKLISAVLGFICLALLVTVGILATKKTEPCSGNVTFSEKTDQKEFISGNLSILPLSTKVQGSKCHPCEDNWHQHGENCYSVSAQPSFWKNCDVHCTTWSSSFLKVNTEKEMDFVKNFSMKQCHIGAVKFWISLYYNSSEQKRAWKDSSAFTLDKIQLAKPDIASNHCKYIQNGQLLDDNCEDLGHCICKKTTFGD